MQRTGYLLPLTLTGSLWLKGLNPHLPGISCPLRALTGIPCPTCFLTRATSSALTGDLNGSLQWHLFGPLTAAGLIGWSVLSIRQKRLMPRGVRAGPLLLTVGLLMIYWLLRLGFGAWPSA